MPQIRLADKSDLVTYYEHTHRLEKESGKSLETIFSPFEAPFEMPFSSVESRANEQWGKSVQEVGWGRLWILVDGPGIYGHIALVHRPDTKTSLHRTTLMMGIETSHRAQSFGKKLMETAIQWTTEFPSIEWIELFVFSNNAPAMRLYKSFGFEEVGTTPDMFRVYGQKISDVKMVLNLRKA